MHNIRTSLVLNVLHLHELSRSQRVTIEKHYSGRIHLPPRHYQAKHLLKRIRPRRRPLHRLIQFGQLALLMGGLMLIFLALVMVLLMSPLNMLSN